MNSRNTIAAIVMVAAGLSGCSDTGSQQPQEKVIDTHSFARPAQARTVHLDLDLDVDFDTKIIQGTARHTIENNGAEEFIVDTKDLNIVKVTIDDSDLAVTHQLTEQEGAKGRALVVPITKGATTVTIYYFTDPEAAALGWLDPEQTADKEMPFLYTQGQAILTRSWIPLQDSPGIRFTYDAKITVPAGMMAVMSASNPQAKNEDGVYEFEMQQPIPAYLIALAVGDIEFGAIDERTGVYAEPSILESAVYEFGETGQMVDIAEELYGPYLWDRYDMIVLPPSFPFGGMENPRLTFLTPTVIAGDRSLVALIAHELAHSWSGNLVTNATWNDFWLNEGFTVYFERRIMEELSGDEYTRMLALLGKQDLEQTVEELGPKSPDTHLYLNLEGRDPDDGMTDIAYEKGAFFLKLLEESAGRATFDAFLKEYFDAHQFESMTTSAFVHYLNKNLLEPNDLNINVEEWIYGPGIPANCPKVESDKFERVEAVIASLTPTGKISGETSEWTTHEWLHFIRHLPSDIQVDQLKELDDTYGFASSGNSEIAAAWYEVSIEQGYAPEIIDQIDAFLVRVGRRKFLMPIYTAMKEAGMTGQARNIYVKARPNYHAVSRQSIDKLLEV